MVITTLKANGHISDLNLQGKILNCGCYAGSSSGVGDFGGSVTHIEQQKEFIDKGILLGRYNPGEIICSDAVDYLEHGKREFDLIAFFGAPNDLPIDRFVTAGRRSLMAGGAIVITYSPPIKNDCDLCSLCLDQIHMPGTHCWDDIVLVGRKN